jgi:hypothetical protein
MMRRKRDFLFGKECTSTLVVFVVFYCHDNYYDDDDHHHHNYHHRLHMKSTTINKVEWILPNFSHLLSFSFFNHVALAQSQIHKKMC